MAGASAGGMTSSITVAQLFDMANYQPVERIPRANFEPTNRFYEAWVKKIDILEMLDVRDLPNRSTKVMSLFDSSIITRIAKSALEISNPQPFPSFVDPNLQIYLTTSNLRGVPYSLDLRGVDGETPYRMSSHADFCNFYFGDQNTALDGIGSVHVNFSDEAAQDLFLQATMATGAFPIGLAPRKINTLKERYEKRLWRAPLDEPS